MFVYGKIAFAFKMLLKIYYIFTYFISVNVAFLCKSHIRVKGLIVNLKYEKEFIRLIT